MRFTSGRVLGALVAIAALAAVPPALAQQGAGSIAGQVTDSASGDAIAGARLQLGNTNFTAVTNAQGRYTIAGVPAGAYQLRVAVVGYASVLKAVTVQAGGIANIDFALRRAVIPLDVVTVTPTGEQSAREQGNATSHIDVAPRVAQGAVVGTMANLLSGQAANVQVLQSSGTTGTGTRIRIRGLSSFSLSNEPVYYVDGIRVESGSNSLSVGTGGQSPSRINDIDPEDIESIEIVKGPSAATLYGTQAANGVVRITTKRGLAGKPRWTVFSEGGVLNDRNNYPTNWFSWGHNLGTGAIQQCILIAAAAGTCAIDSLTSSNVLMDPSRTPFGTGYRGQTGVQVSGGSDQAQYFVSADYEDERGVLRLPSSEWGRITTERGTPPTYDEYRPNALKRTSLRSNVTTHLTRTLDAALQAGLVMSDVRLPQNDNNVLGLLPSGYFGRGFIKTPTARDIGTGNTYGGEWGFFRPGEVFGVHVWQDITRFTGSGNVNWRPTPWLSGRAVIGLDYTGRTDQSLQIRGQGPNFINFRNGRKSDNRFAINHYTADVGGTATFQLTPDINSRSSVGVQYLRDVFFGNTTFGQELAPGGSTVSAAALQTAGETTDITVTLGYYAEQAFGWLDRRFLTLGLRTDRNSAFGSQFHTVYYPKVQGSWVLSEESFFPRLPLDNLRLRMAYGASGEQPGTTDALLFYGSNTAAVAGADIPAVALAALGNPVLKPERSTELETGFDVSFFDRTTSLQFTYYHKKTTDALVSHVLAPSLGGPSNRLENLGSVLNKGLEVTLSVQTNVGPTVAVDATLSGSKNTNKLLSLGAGIPPVRGTQAQVPGYPLFGFWDRPIKGFSDANGDGIITASEITVGDTAEFLGSSVPTKEASFNAGVTFFRGKVRLGGQLDYRGGFKQFNLTDYFRCTSGAANNCAYINNPDASLADQARAVAGRTAAFGFTQAGFIENAAFMKLRELSLTYYAPAAWARLIGAERLNFTVAGRNLATITNYTGVDPEVNQIGQSDFSRDFLTQPPVRYWTFRVNVGF